MSIAEKLHSPARGAVVLAMLVATGCRSGPQAIKVGVFFAQLPELVAPPLLAEAELDAEWADFEATWELAQATWRADEERRREELLWQRRQQRQDARDRYEMFQMVQQGLGDLAQTVRRGAPRSSAGAMPLATGNGLGLVQAGASMRSKYRAAAQAYRRAAQEYREKGELDKAEQCDAQAAKMEQVARQLGGR